MGIRQFPLIGGQVVLKYSNVSAKILFLRQYTEEQAYNRRGLYETFPMTLSGSRLFPFEMDYFCPVQKRRYLWDLAVKHEKPKEMFKFPYVCTPPISEKGFFRPF